MFISGRAALRDLAFEMEMSSYVYMMGSASRRALYTGVMALLYERVWELYFEQFTNIEAAIEREKEIKGWRRDDDAFKRGKLRSVKRVLKTRKSLVDRPLALLIFCHNG